MRSFKLFVAVAALAGMASAGTFWRAAPDGVPGAVSVTSTEDGKTRFECIGYADLASQRKMTPDTIFDVTRDADVLVAATVLSAVGEGKILLDEGQPTVRTLLRQKDGSVRARIQEATGRPFEVEMIERLFGPLGMTNTTFVRGPAGDDGIRSTPRDMIRFFRMIADGGKAPDGAVIIPAGLMKVQSLRQLLAKTAHGQVGTWGEADAKTQRVRLLMANVGSKSAAYRAFRDNWMKVTDLNSQWFWYSSEYLGLDRTKTQREALIRELWQHDAAAETKLWPEGKVPLRQEDKPLRFVEHELWQRNLVVSDINDPFFVFYSAGKKDAPVAVVLPGGGYTVLGWNKEGTEVARWLNENSVSAAVLLYRAPDQRQAALCDVQRTIGILRRDAAKYGIDPKKVGVIGFSAGANLAVAASTNWRKRAYERVDDADDQPCRPDFQLPIYLWDVLERDPSDMDITPLLENGKEPKIRAEYPVDAETPPAFLAQAKDDFCQIETTVFYYRALQAAGVKDCRMETFASGGHGYGLRKVGNPTDAWSDLAAEWLQKVMKR